MGGFGVAKPRNLRCTTPLRRLSDAPQFLVDLEGRCIYASVTLARMLQCGLDELYGSGWRARLSPYGNTPFDSARLEAIARSKKAMHHNTPDGARAIVTRLQLVTDPDHPERVTGFWGRVQLVRLHRRLLRTAVTVASALVASA